MIATPGTLGCAVVFFPVGRSETPNLTLESLESLCPQASESAEVEPLVFRL